MGFGEHVERAPWLRRARLLLSEMCVKTGNFEVRKINSKSGISHLKSATASFRLDPLRSPSASYNHFLVNHRPILLENPIWLLLLQDQPFDSSAEDLGVDGDEVGGQREDLDHIGGQPVGEHRV